MTNKTEIINKFDSILARGLCHGVGNRDGQMCIEAAICAALGEPHGDIPSCVAWEVREYSIVLSDSCWSSPQARAAGLRAVGVAQLGSVGVVDDKEFTKMLALRTVQVLIPKLFREVFPHNQECLEAATRCEIAVDTAVAETAYFAAARAAETADYAAWTAEDAARAANYATSTASAAYAAFAARAARYAASATAATQAVEAADSDRYLLLSADLALDVLRALKSPGVEWL